MTSALRSSSLLWLSSVLTLAVLACGGDSEVTPPPAAGTAAETAAPGAGFTLEPPGASVELHEDFPADVPRYADARIARAAGGRGGYSATFVTSKDVDDATEDYAERLDEEGWTTQVQGAGDEQLIVATKDERTVVATVQESTTGTVITLVVGEAN